MGPSADRSGGSGAGVLPAPLPAVEGTGGAGGGRGFRAARTTNAVLPPTTTMPPMSNPIATQSRKDSLAPRSMSALTPREPSAFIRTTDQSPSRTFHVSVCVSHPEGGGGPEALLRRRRLRRASREREVRGSEGVEVDVLDVRVGDVSEVPGDLRLRPDADEQGLVVGALAADPDARTSSRSRPQHLSVGVDLEPRARQRVGRRRKPLGRRRQVAVLALRSVGPEQEASPCQNGDPEQDPMLPRTMRTTRPALIGTGLQPRGLVLRSMQRRQVASG